MTFDDFNFHPDLMQGIRDMRFVNPTPIQEKSILPAMQGKDLIANAQTGSGKTAAFLLPLMHRALEKSPGKTRSLILAPTRELVCQIDEQALGFGYHTPIKSAAIYGGVKMESQEQSLLSGTSIIIATPGRLLDHHKYGSWRFDDLDSLVLDEADRMLDMGFWPDIQSIISKLPEKKQTLLFSATMPEPIAKLAKKIMQEPAHIKIGLVRPPSSISQCLYPVGRNKKEELLLHLVNEHPMESTIIFVATKIGANRLHRALEKEGIQAGLIHGDLEQAYRDKSILDFKTNKTQILVATDVASRGIDVQGVSHVINFDIPSDTDTYIHRIGRTARAKAVGDAFTFVTDEDSDRVSDIEKVLGREIPRKILEQFQFKGDKSLGRREGNRNRFSSKKFSRPGRKNRSGGASGSLPKRGNKFSKHKKRSK